MWLAENRAPWRSGRGRRSARGNREINRVWLLWNDAPSGGIKTPLILFDVELPIGVKVSGEVDGSELDDGLCHLLGPAHTRQELFPRNRAVAVVLILETPDAQPGWMLVNR